MLKLSVILNFLSKFVLAAILLAVPLYPKFPLFNVPGTFVAIRLEDILLLAASIITAVSIIQNKKGFLGGDVNKSFLWYVAGSSISLFCAVFVLQTVVPHIALLHLIRRVEYFFAFFLAVETVRRNKDISAYYLKLILLIVILAFFYGVGQRYFNFPIIVTQNEEYSKGLALRYVEGGHINSTFAGHYDLATFLVLVLPIILSAFFVFKEKYSKIFTSFTFLSGLWLLVNTASRISFVSYLMSVTFTLILVKKVKWIPLILVISLLFIGTSSNLIARYGRVFEVVSKKYINFNQMNYQFAPEVFAADEDTGLRRIKDAPTPTPVPVFEDRSTNIRLAVEWPRAIRAFTKNPLLGTGFSSITLATDNDYLRLLGETGIVGFLTFTLILFRVLTSLFSAFPLTKNFNESDLVIVSGVLGAFPGILLNAFFIDVFEASKFAIFFWLLIGVAVSLVKYRKYE